MKRRQWSKGLNKETDERIASRSFSNIGRVAWNKGLTKENDARVANGALSLSKSLTGKPGHPISNETKLKLSCSLKLAHKEGRAWNIGRSRWKNKPSYPEKFFIKVIQNDFLDKEYRREVPFHRFSLDFVWFNKKKVIEIDGKQHDIDLKQKQRDIEKDRLLILEGWQILRIKWKDLCNDSKYWILVGKNFIDSAPID